MAVVMILDSPNFGTDMYDAVNAKMDITANPPEGLICHTAGVVDGNFRIIDVWESEDDYERFSKDRLGPAIQEVSEGQAPQPQGGERPEKFYELHNVIAP
jgi:hypothetical protein